jgi:hypothetical protein
MRLLKTNPRLSRRPVLASSNSIVIISAQPKSYCSLLVSQSSSIMQCMQTKNVTVLNGTVCRVRAVPYYCHNSESNLNLIAYGTDNN